MNYYNEIDKRKAAWLRELIKRNVISEGIVDERSIVDVQPGDLDGYRQCHWFAGIGVWSYSLRLAGVSDDEPVWTGSCPCTPFSQAGRKKGKEDERHLWPSLFRLIDARRPVRFFGEQVSNKDGLAWLDDVRLDLDAAGYESGSVDLCAASCGAPHVRQRLYFMAYANGSDRRTGISGAQAATGEDRIRRERLAGDSATGDVAESAGGRLHVRTISESDCTEERSRTAWIAEHCRTGATGGSLGNAAPRRRGVSRNAALTGSGGHSDGAVIPDGSLANDNTQGRTVCGTPQHVLDDLPPWDITDGCGTPLSMAYAHPEGLEGRGRPERFDNTQGRTDEERRSTAGGAVNGFWSDAEWVWCRDGKYRPTGPGIKPLAHGSAARVLRLRGYGDAIVAPVAAEFIRAAMSYPPAEGPADSS